MPTLNWLGKDKVINHHQDVPFRVLDFNYQYGESDTGNMIIHGDNLDALKTLLPQYEGRVKCIYIDPPYNTGNEGWVYNDNVNDPKIRKWLGEVVGREGEDLSRHDKWLCMMYPRLMLLQRLLAEDGAIFISIDDNEQANLKLICDEIFGKNCFISNVSWQRTYSMRNDSKGVPVEVEHIVVYSKNESWLPRRLPRTAKMDSKYKNPDNDYTLWRSTIPTAPGAVTHQGMVYAIQHPFTGEMLYPTVSRCWPLQQEKMLEIMNGWCSFELRDIDDAWQRAKVCGIDKDEVRVGVKGIVLSRTLEESREMAGTVYKRGQWPVFFFSKGGYGGINRKTYLDQVGGYPASNLWTHSETGHTDEAQKQLLELFEGGFSFDTPKPTRLIERILQIATDKNSIVLDSFAGSGTTAHAVLNMNKQDDGSRKFILVEMEDYAKTITAERVSRVIDGYADKPGTGGGFYYYELGEPLLFPDGNLNENIPDNNIYEYIWYTETKTAYTPHSQYYLGTQSGTAYFFYYKREQITMLDTDFLKTYVNPQSGEVTERYVIYADTCVFDDTDLGRFNITFKKIPRDISKL